MASISLKTVKDCVKTRKFLRDMEKLTYLKVLYECGKKGVSALESATPKDSGKTAASWSFEIDRSSKNTTIIWKNSNLTRDGDPIAIMLQYGHGTGTGGYVVGRDYINPALKPVFDEIAERVWEVIRES